jgi:hypothetical protein
MDAVYTWVDGSHPLAVARREALGRRSGAALAPIPPQRRGRDLGTLRYSLRSLERFAPWIDRVFLVTGGEVPAWLDVENPRLTVVPHVQLFPDPSHLPTFNSFAIECHLHRIAGITTSFLYFNDDFVLGREIRPTDIRTASGMKCLYLSDWGYDETPLEGDSDITAHAKRTNQLLTARLGFRDRLMIAHVPYLIIRDVMTELCAELDSAFTETSRQPFRNKGGINPIYLHDHYLNETGRTVPGTATKAFLGLTTDRQQNLAWFETQRRSPAHFICVNDDLPDDYDPQIAGDLDQFLSEMLTEPSTFER